MRFMLSVQNDESVPLPEGAEWDASLARVEAVNDEMRAQGIWVFGGGLQLSDSAKVVRVRDGATTMTDGPFAELFLRLGERAVGHGRGAVAHADDLGAVGELQAAAEDPDALRPHLVVDRLDPGEGGIPLRALGQGHALVVLDGQHEPHVDRSSVIRTGAGRRQGSQWQ